ncbi:PREDICTED: uncharacterized protein LOC108366840 [Rhagoletis zephyria]|uniref:uncharacterized protein LOC108366840 n=1 Tax=Rhagoletis zephyria TaxID=28612 RepID=UPI00081185C7|nr:PREDICTED: uncharacterized protein LOC108366840 [Rhagoletis zephyria]
MEYQDKIELMQDIFKCIEEAVEIDSDDSEREDICKGLINMCEKVAKMPIRKKNREWTKVWREAKSEKGSFAFLTKELLISDKASYKNYLRMTETQFNFLLSFIKEDLRKQDTIMWSAISPAEKLSLTLRFLATGETFQSLNFHSKISKAAISGIIRMYVTLFGLD